MKKLFIISALFLGFSLSGMSQSTTESVTLTVVSKVTGQDGFKRYELHTNSGDIYESLTNQAQLLVGEMIIAQFRGVDKDQISRGIVIAKTGSVTPHTEFKAIVENERTGLLFLKGK